MAYLQQFLDPELEVRTEDTAEQITAEEVERLLKLHAVASAAIRVPRRLGPDANSDELAADTHTSRRIAHVAEQCLKAWGGEVKPGPDVSREAAQVRWRRWLQEHNVHLVNRMRYVATWQYKTGSDDKWAKGAVVRFQNEARWLEYALRDCP